MKELFRSSPESVGIRSSKVLELVERLEYSETEMHSLMIACKGRVIAEGWWAPYAAGYKHAIASHTKTYAATAVGFLWQDHLLSLEDKICDMFPEFLPEKPDKKLLKMTVRDVLMMSTGMRTQPGIGQDQSNTWLHQFFTQPVVDEPGTAYYYNNSGSTLLTAIVRKITGQDLETYLYEKMFEKIGICANDFFVKKCADGTSFGAAGGYATTECNLRFMMLYAQNGLWDGEQVLSEEWIRMASANQISTAHRQEKYEDGRAGYGYQIWRCKVPGAYRADGSGGQYTIVVPDLELTVSITENGKDNEQLQETLNAVWETIVADGVSEPLPEDEKAYTRLRKRLAGLALPAPKRSPRVRMEKEIEGRSFSVRGQGFIPCDFAGSEPNEVKEISFHFKDYFCELTMCYDDNRVDTMQIGLSGNYSQTIYEPTASTDSIIACSGYWISDNSIEIEFRCLEEITERKYCFTFDEEVTVTRRRNKKPTEGAFRA